MIDRLRYVLFCSETSGTRFWFGLLTVGFAAYMGVAADPQEYALALQIMPTWAWATALLINGLFLVAGVFTQRFSFALMMVEGVLGTFAWSVMGIATSISLGLPSAPLVASLVSIWILMRYPTWS